MALSALEKKYIKRLTPKSDYELHEMLKHAGRKKRKVIKEILAQREVMRNE